MKLLREESLQQQYGEQIEGLQQIIWSHVERLEEKEETIAAGQQEIQQLREQLREKIHQLENERQGKESEILKLSMHISELELQFSKKEEAKVQ